MYDLVAEVGYDKASIGKICDFVGISKPSVYYYFPCLLYTSDAADE